MEKGALPLPANFSNFLFLLHIAYLTVSALHYSSTAWLACESDILVKIFLFLIVLSYVTLPNTKHRKGFLLFQMLILSWVSSIIVLSGASDWSWNHVVFYLFGFCLLYAKFKRKMPLGETLVFVTLIGLSISFLWELAPAYIPDVVSLNTNPLEVSTILIESIPTLILLRLIEKKQYVFCPYAFIPAIVLGLLYPIMSFQWLLRGLILRLSWLLPFITLRT